MFTTILMSCGKQTVQYDNSNGSSSFVWNENQLPLTIHVPDELSSGYRTAIENAVNTWNNALHRQVFNMVYDGIPNTQFTAKYQSLDDSIMGLYKENNWISDGNENVTLASTVYKARGSNFTQADVLFNFQHFNFYDYDDRKNSPYGTNYADLESVLTHELGHFLGLVHVSTNDDPDSVMNPSLSLNYKKRILSTKDLAKIQSMYP